jgi:hypothetical protein
MLYHWATGERFYFVIVTGHFQAAKTWGIICSIRGRWGKRTDFQYFVRRRLFGCASHALGW